MAPLSPVLRGEGLYPLSPLSPVLRGEGLYPLSPLSPVLRGEGLGVRGRLFQCKTPHPNPSPRSTGEREKENASPHPGTPGRGAFQTSFKEHPCAV